MRRSAIAIVVPALLLSGVLLAAPGSGDTTQPSESLRAFAAGPVSQQAVKRTPGNLGDASDLFVEDEVLVTFKRDVKREEAARVHAVRGGGTVLSAIRGLGPRIDHVRLAPGLSVAQAVRRYERDPRVAFAEPNFRYELANHLTFPIDDLEYDGGELWGLENTGQPHDIADDNVLRPSGTFDADIDAEAAWAIPEQGETNETIVAVVDSGVRVTHEDLNESLWVNESEDLGTPSVDDDGNGYVDDVNGCSFAPPQCTNLTDEAPEGGHGTHVAGTIAAEGEGPNLGIIGVCPHCKIMVVKFDLTTAGEVQAYAYARKNGADVINGSFGGPIWSKTAYNAIKQLNNAGIVAVFAAANSQLDNDLALAHPGSGDLSPAFPASYNLPNIIAVAASNHKDEYGYFTGCNHALGASLPKKVCSFSNVGHDSVDLAAPGVDIKSSVKLSNSSYDVYNGTSMAAPHVAGVAGLVHSANPGLTAVQIKNKIMNGADKNLSTLSRFYSQVLKGGSAAGKFTRTSGRLNAEGALNAAATNATPRTDGNVDGAKRIAKSKKGRVRYPDDVNDVYKKRLKKGKRYRVVLKVGKKDFDLWIWKPGVKEIFQFEAGCYFNGKCPVVAVGFSPKGKNEVVTFKAKKAGVYYFQVEAWLKMRGGYKLIIKRI